MAAAVVQQKSGVVLGAVGDAELTLTLDSPTSAGNTLVVCLSAYDNTISPAWPFIEDNNGNEYFPAADQWAWSTYSGVVQIQYAPDIVGRSSQQVFVQVGNCEYLQVLVLEVSGVDASPVKASGLAEGQLSDTFGVSGSVTPSVASFVVAALTEDAGKTVSEVTAGWTEAYDGNTGQPLHVAYRLGAASTAAQCTFVYAAGNATAGAMVLALEEAVEAELPAYAAAVLADDPISWWRMGSLAGHDEMGVSPDTPVWGGTVVAGVLSGDSDPAVQFNGSTDELGTPLVAAHQIASGSIEAWIKTADAGTGHRAIAVKESAWGMFLFGNELQAYDWGPGGGQRSTGVYLNDGQRHHVVQTFQSGVAGGTRFYVDGVAVGSPFQITVASQGAGFSIAANGANASQRFTGVIDEVALYDAVLTPTQIAAHYAAGTGAAGATESAAAAISGAGSLTAAAVRRRAASMLAAGASSLQVQARRTRRALASVGGAASLAISARRSRRSAALVAASSSVAVSATVIPAGGGPWTPASIPGLALWVDAMADSFSDGQAVGTYVEHSAAARVFTAQAGVEPIYRDGVRPYLELWTAGGGSGGYVSSAPWNAGTAGLTFACVCRITGGSYPMMVVWGPDANGFEMRHDGSAQQVVWMYSSYGIYFSNAAPSGSLVDHIFMARVNAGVGSSIWTNDDLTTGAAPAAMPNVGQTLYVGRREGGYPFVGRMYEVLAFEGAISDVDRQALDDYLYAKWLGSLPVEEYGAAALAGAGSLAVAAVRTRQAQSAVAGAATLQVQARRTRAAQAVVGASSSLACSATVVEAVIEAGAAVVAATSSVTVSARRARTAVAMMAGASTLEVMRVRRTRRAAAVLEAASSVSISGHLYKLWRGAAAIAGQGRVEVSAVRGRIGQGSTEVVAATGTSTVAGVSELGRNEVVPDAAGYTAALVGAAGSTSIGRIE